MVLFNEIVVASSLVEHFLQMKINMQLVVCHGPQYTASHLYWSQVWLEGTFGAFGSLLISYRCISTASQSVLVCWSKYLFVLSILSHIAFLMYRHLRWLQVEYVAF